MLEDGIIKGDTSTWPIKYPLAEIYGAMDGPPWTHVFTARLKGAIDQLCGASRWEDFGCGW